MQTCTSIAVPVDSLGKLEVGDGRALNVLAALVGAVRNRDTFADVGGDGLFALKDGVGVGRRCRPDLDENVARIAAARPPCPWQ